MTITLTALLGFIGTLGAFLIKEVYEYAKSKLTKAQEQKDEQLIENTKAVSNLNQSIAKLEVQIEFMAKALEAMPKMQKDINEAHLKIRDIKSKTKSNHKGS